MVGPEQHRTEHSPIAFNSLNSFEAINMESIQNGAISRKAVCRSDFQVPIPVEEPKLPAKCQVPKPLELPAVSAG
jgi:hypothetical protein